MPDTIERLAERVARDLRDRSSGFNVAFLPKASVEDVQLVEEEFGLALPTLLRRAYLEVANGGFGPGYGVMGIYGGFARAPEETMIGLYNLYMEPNPEDATWNWPRGLLPFCHWGCLVYSAVDALSEGNPVVFMDIGVKEAGEPMTSITVPHKPTLKAWFDDWLDGVDLWREVWP